MNITAEITGLGADTTVPDNPNAVDAAIFIDGVQEGEVTLLPDHTGNLTSWGSLDNWASASLHDIVVKDPNVAGDIIWAVKQALKEM